MLVVVRELLHVPLYLIVVLLSEFEWTLFQVISGVSMVDEGAKHPLLLRYHHEGGHWLLLHQHGLPNAMSKKKVLQHF